MSSEQQLSTLDFPFGGKWEAVTLDVLWKEKPSGVLTIKQSLTQLLLMFTKTTLKVCIVRFPCLSVLPLGPIKISYIVPSTVAPAHQNPTANSCTDCTGSTL